MHTLTEWGIRILGLLFAIGMVGSALALTGSFWEDLKAILGKDHWTPEI